MGTNGLSRRNGTNETALNKHTFSFFVSFFAFFAKTTNSSVSVKILARFQTSNGAKSPNFWRFVLFQLAVVMLLR
jgi:hypothetical protein